MRYISYIIVFTLLLLCISPAQAAKVQEIKTRNGITAWLVEDHKLPLISMHFAFRGGVEQDPVDKQGLATLAMDMLTEGAGAYDAAAFQQKLADRSIALNFDASRDALKGMMKMLSADRAEAFAMLTLAMTQPKLDIKDFERQRGKQMSAMRAQLDNPGWQARYALFRKIFANHPYSERKLGTVASIARLTQADAKNFLANHMARDNLVVAVAGDITASELTALLDQSFGKLPRHAHLNDVQDIVFSNDASIISVPREGTQTVMLFSMPGPKEDSPDWYAGEIANYILGGGGFSSRLMQDVRDKKGLTYGIDTDVVPSEHAGLIVGQSATENNHVKEAWDIMQQTMHRFFDDGVTAQEINMAKDFLTGSLPLSLTSTDRISGALLEMELQHKPANYLDIRNDLIRAVTADEVQNAIRRWFDPDRMTLVMVGKPEGMVTTETHTLVRQ